MRKFLLITSSLAVLAACDLSPELKMPKIDSPEKFKEEAAAADDQTTVIEPVTDGKWKRFDEHAKIEEFAWWRMFNDPTLNELEEAAMKDSASLEAAISKVKKARASAETADAALYPTVDMGFGPTRQRQSPAAQEPNLPPGITPVTKPYTLHNFRGNINYELDLFGRNRATARASQHDAEAEANNYLAARLTLQADVAQTYFRVAALRQEADILKRNIAGREQALKVTKNQMEIGDVDALAVNAIETDVANVKADAAVVAQALAQQEHALAVLVGQPPSALKVETKALTSAPPAIPAGLPSRLLERRPDIQRAAENIAAANERIGVARTGYFPDITLSASGGFTSGELGDLFKWSNRTWLLGPLVGTMLTQPIFEGGRVAAAKASSEAGFAQATAEYRETVLQAFREVEDQLSNLRTEAEQGKAVDQAYNASSRSLSIANDRFKAGYASYLDQLDAERNSLNAKRGTIQVLSQRYISTVQLVRALGGSWQTPPASATAHVTPAADTAPAAEVKPAAEPEQKDDKPEAKDENSNTWLDDALSIF